MSRDDPCSEGALSTTLKKRKKFMEDWLSGQEGEEGEETVLKKKKKKVTANQTLTRVSISRNSRREMTHSFLSRAGEMNFHVLFSSRFSRF